MDIGLCIGFIRTVAGRDRQGRTLPVEIERLARIGMIMEDNPDMTYAFAKGSVQANDEVGRGLVERYVRRERDAG
jgi:hypothetical protein